MLDKNIDKQKRKNRPTWVGYFQRKTPTKKEKIQKQEQKEKQKDGYRNTEF